MKVTCFPRLRTAQGYVQELESVEHLIADLVVCEAKDEAPLFSPTEFADGRRSNAKALVVHFGVVEFDHLTAEQTLAVLAHLEGSGVAFAFYTTWSHAPDNEQWNFRVAVPFSEPLDARAWTSVYWPRLVSVLSPPGIDVGADPQCKDPARIYYVPSCPRSREAFAERFFRPGRLLGPADFGAVPIAGVASKPMFERAGGARTLTRDDLRVYQRRLRGRDSGCALAASECLKAVLRGDAWGDKSTRNERLSSCCYELVKDFPDLDPDQVATLFTASCQLVQKQDDEAKKYTVDFVATKLREKTKYVAERQRQYAIDDHASYLRELNRLGFDGPLSQEEVADLVEMGVHPQGYVLQQGTGAWVYTMKRGYLYFPTVLAARGVARENLLTVKPYGIDTMRRTKDGKKLMALDEMVQSFGCEIEDLRGSLLASRTTWDREARMLTVAECPLRPLEPRYNENIAGWLKLLGGDKHESLLDWIAWCTHLDRPCSMLVISGPKGVGKSLLGNALARLWNPTGEATPLADALDNFNARLAKCPLLLADERVPRDRDGKPRFEDLRELISKRSFGVNEKYVAKREVMGCVRVIVAVNALSLLVGETPESNDELEATLERILHVSPDASASEYLRELTEVRGEYWSEDAIAQHALWLREQRPIPASAPRFLFRPMAQMELANAFVSSSAMYGAICQWLISFLREPGKLYQGITSGSDPAWRVKVNANGRLCATAHAIQAHWLKYSDKRPFQKSVQSAWVGLHEGKTNIGTPEGDKKTDTVDLDRLVAWAEEHTVSDREEIAALIERYLYENTYGNAERALSMQKEFASSSRAMARPTLIKT